ncbi:hypothetical protein QZH41_011577, partial [Actinostola sp. cb2023]
PDMEFFQQIVNEMIDQATSIEMVDKAAARIVAPQSPEVTTANPDVEVNEVVNDLVESTEFALQSVENVDHGQLSSLPKLDMEFFQQIVNEMIDQADHGQLSSLPKLDMEFFQQIVNEMIDQATSIEMVDKAAAGIVATQSPEVTTANPDVEVIGHIVKDLVQEVTTSVDVTTCSAAVKDTKIVKADKKTKANEKDFVKEHSQPSPNGRNNDHHLLQETTRNTEIVTVFFNQLTGKCDDFTGRDVLSKPLHRREIMSLLSSVLTAEEIEEFALEETDYASLESDSNPCDGMQNMSAKVLVEETTPVFQNDVSTTPPQAEENSNVNNVILPEQDVEVLQLVSDLVEQTATRLDVNANLDDNTAKSSLAEVQPDMQVVKHGLVEDVTVDVNNSSTAVKDTKDANEVQERNRKALLQLKPDDEIKRHGIILLYDLANVSYKTCDVPLCIKIITMLKTAYPIKLKKTLIIGPPFWFEPEMKLLSRLLSDRKRNKIQIVQRSAALKDYLAVTCIPEGLGGRFHIDYQGWIDQCLLGYSEQLLDDDVIKPRLHQY